MRTTHEQFTMYDDVFHAQNVPLSRTMLPVLFNGNTVQVDEVPARATYSEEELDSLPSIQRSVALLNDDCYRKVWYFYLDLEEYGAKRMCSEEEIRRPNGFSNDYATRRIIDKAVYKRFRNAVVILNITFSIGNCTRCLSCGPIGYRCALCYARDWRNSRSYYRNVYVENPGSIETHEVYNPIELAEAAKGRVDIYFCLDDFTNGDMRIWHMHQDVTITRDRVREALNRNWTMIPFEYERFQAIQRNTGIEVVDGP